MLGTGICHSSGAPFSEDSGAIGISFQIGKTVNWRNMQKCGHCFGKILYTYQEWQRTYKSCLLILLCLENELCLRELWAELSLCLRNYGLQFFKLVYARNCELYI